MRQRYAREGITLIDESMDDTLNIEGTVFTLAPWHNGHIRLVPAE